MARRIQFDRRLRSAFEFWSHRSGLAFETRFADELEEFESDASVPLLETFLDRVEAARIEGLGPVPDPSSPRPPGRLLCHTFSRSLSTGEAEIASRGFFDSLDRPPIALWLEVVSRPMPRGSEAFEVCVLAFVPEQILARAIAGRKACPSGALAFLDEVSPTLTDQLDVGGVPILQNGR